MQRSYADAYAGLHERHWWWRARQELVVDFVRRHPPPPGDPHILDVGCGDGLYFDALRPFGVPEGVEPDGAIVTERGRARGAIHVGLFDDSFRPAHRFGMILALDVVEHVEDDLGFLRRAHSLLVPGGRLLLTVPAFQALWTHHDVLNLHVRRYTRERLAAVVRQAGLEVEESRYFFHWLAPVKLAIRAKEGLLGPGEEVPRVPPEPLNAFFLTLSRLERALPRLLQPPFGTSVLLAATRPSTRSAAATGAA